MWNKKLFFFLLLPFFLVIVVSTAFYLRILKIPSQSTSKKVEFRDDIGAKNIRFQKDAFEKLAYELKIWDKGVYNWTKTIVELEEDDIVIPDKIVVILTPEEQLFFPAQGVFEIGGKMEKTESLAQKIDKKTKTLTIYVHYSQKFFPAVLQDGTFPRTLSHRTAFALYKMSLSNGIEISKKTYKNISSQDESDFIFKLLDKTGYIFVDQNPPLIQNFFLFAKKIQVIKSVYAGCSGQRTCGVIQTTKKCSTTGIACAAPCGDPCASGHGTCRCTDTCPDSPNKTTSCGGQPNKTDWDNVDCIGGSYNCHLNSDPGSCTWTDPTAAPTKTKTPAPPQPTATRTRTPTPAPPTP